MKEKPYKINSSGICPTGSRARRYFGICPLWDKSQTPHGSKESCHLTLSPHSLRPTQKESHLTVAFSDCRKSRSTASKVKNIAGKGFTLFSASNKNQAQKRRGSHRENPVVACFLRNRSLQYHRTATKTISQNIPSFFNVCQRVDRFIDTLKRHGKLDVFHAVLC